MYVHKIEKEIFCPLEYGLDIFGGKWKSRIICVIAANKVLRYSAIRKELSNISDAVLGAMLKELLEDGILNREQYDSIPPKVEYSMTEKGETILPILQSICQWSKEYSENEITKKLTPCITCKQV